MSRRQPPSLKSGGRAPRMDPVVQDLVEEMEREENAEGSQSADEFTTPKADRSGTTQLAHNEYLLLPPQSGLHTGSRLLPGFVYAPGHPAAGGNMIPRAADSRTEVSTNPDEEDGTSQHEPEDVHLFPFAPARHPDPAQPSLESHQSRNKKNDDRQNGNRASNQQNPASSNPDQAGSSGGSGPVNPGESGPNPSNSQIIKH